MTAIPQISIILPVYNGGKLITKCLDSILNQDLSDFELIVVNDGSTDNSLSICEEYTAKDERIRIFSQKNGGVSSARNCGLDHARGKYICFVDADDWVEKEYLSTFFKYGPIGDREIVIQNCFEDIGGVSALKARFSDKVYTKESFSEVFTQLRILNYGYPFGKLYQSEIIKQHQLRFDERIRFAEDLIFLLHYLQYIDSLRTISEATYHYVCPTSSVSLSHSHHAYESEIRAFNDEKRMVEVLTKQFNLNAEAVYYSKSCQGFFFYRAIRAIYRPGLKEPFKNRISILRAEHTPSNIACLEVYNACSVHELSNKICIFLYTKKWFYLYDIYTRFFMFLRYNPQIFEFFLKRA